MQTREEKRQKKNIIKVYLSADTGFDFSSSSDYQNILFDTCAFQEGDKLTYDTSTGKVTVGSGISYVRVSWGVIFYDNSGTTMRTDLYHTGEIVSSFFSAMNTSVNYNGLAPCSSIVSVNEGDAIYIRIANYSNKTTTVNGREDRTFLIVEAI